MNTIIAGGGFIARTHLSAVRSLGHEVTWIAGRNAARTQAFAEENRIDNWTIDIDEALASNAEVVHICTPPGEHAGIIRKCLAAGKHIICEKPLCMDPDEAAALAEEAEAAYQERGIITALCCNVRYYPANQEIMHLIRSDSNARPLVLSGSYLQQFHIPPHEDGWRFDPEKNGGQRAISEIGTHWFDLAYAWSGIRISSVFAELRNWYPYRYRKDGKLTLDPDGEKIKVNTEDTAAILMRFENGGIGTLLLSETAPGHSNDLSIEVTDLRNSYKWEELHPETIWYSEEGEMKSKQCTQDDTVSADSDNDAAVSSEDVREKTFTALFRDVYAAIAGEEHGKYPDFTDGAYIVAVCSAVKKSAETGEWVSLQ